MQQEYENTDQLDALTSERISYADNLGRPQTMFSMDVRTALKFVTRLKGQKPTVVRDNIVDTWTSLKLLFA